MPKQLHPPFYRRAICLLLILLSTSFLHAEKKPNIVLVMADDQGWGEMGYIGHKEKIVPKK
ncbi:MAG: hypothetical protein L3J39_17730 [Verrucomicrobiales bacterium]|nr:hypothetical protein [Verrucomicrobiales bacterium]